MNNQNIESDPNLAYASIANETRDLERLLRSVKHGAKNLADLDFQDGSCSNIDHAKRRKLQLAKKNKEVINQSSWAKSKVPSVAISNNKSSSKPPGSNDLETIEVLKAEQKLKTRGPAFSFGVPKSPYNGSIEKALCFDIETPGPLTYHVTENMLSTRKRPHTVTFGKTKNCGSNYSKDDVKSGQKPESDDLTDVEVKDIEILEFEETVPAGYSFGKAGRFTSQQAKDEPESILDVNRAENAMRAHTGTAIMAMPSFSSKKKTADPDDQSDVDQNPDYESEPYERVGNENALSTRFRSPALTVYRSNSATKPRRARSPDLGTPGPGFYQVGDKAMAFTRKGYNVSCGPAIKTPPRSISRTHKTSPPLSRELGPGYYSPKEKKHVPTFTFQAPSEEKYNPHLERKKYFEQKAQDMREFHDDMKLADDSCIRPRISTFQFTAPKSNKKNNNKANNSVKAAKISKKATADYNGRSYQVKYDLVERKSSTGALFGKEADARKSTERLLSQKPLAQQLLIQKSFGDDAARKYYGPQLPIQWTKDKPSTSEKGKRDGSESPTAEILRMLDNKEGLKEDEELTEAYLSSKYSGSHQKTKTGVIYSSSKPEERDAGIRKLTPQEREFEFLSTQLQPDWTEDAKDPTKRYKSQGLVMDKVPGRETKKVLTKGVVLVDNFEDHRIYKTDELGPGVYDTMAGKEIAAGRAKGVIPFSKVISREDQVGIHGEKPQSAIEDIDSNDLLGHEELDIDYASAKDQAMKNPTKKGITLYAKDRYPEEKKGDDDPGRDHIGGTWFEGMAEEAKKRNTGPSFDKMKGRSILEDDLEAFDSDFRPIDKALQLEVQDWQPHKATKAKRVDFKDPAKYPRFEKEREKPDLEPLDPKYDILKEREPTGVVMSKMLGRENPEAEEDLLRGDDVLGGRGKLDKQLAFALADEQAAALERNKDLQRKKVRQIDMTRQIGRGDNDREREKEVIDAAIDEAGRIHYEPSSQPNPTGLSSRGALDWNKQPSKMISKEENDIVNAELGVQDQELDVKPGIEGTSKYKKVKSAPRWDSQTADRFGNEASTGIPVAKPGQELDLEDIDPGNFKKGLKPMDQGKKTTGRPTMANAVGRQESAAVNFEEEVGITNKGELDIAPTDKTLAPRLKQSSAMKSQVDRFSGPKRLTNEEEEFGRNSEALILEVDDTAVRQSLKAPPTMASKQARLPDRHESQVLRSLNLQQDELKLEVDDAPLRQSVPNNSALRNSESRFPSRLEDKIAKDELKTKTVLDIDPKDTATKSRVTGSQFGKSTDRKSTTANKKAEPPKVNENSKTATSAKVSASTTKPATKQTTTNPPTLSPPRLSAPTPKGQDPPKGSAMDKLDAQMKELGL